MTLDPDPVRVGVQILDPLVRVGDDLGRLFARVLEAILGLRSRLCGDLLGGRVRALQNARDLLADPLERLADRGLG